jgi:hypothetical protein
MGPAFVFHRVILASQYVHLQIFGHRTRSVYTGLKIDLVFQNSLTMKKITSLIVCVLLFVACSKEENNNAKPPTILATIDYAGDPAADGFGWILRITTDSSEIPRNLPENFKKQDLVVNVAYRKTDHRFPCRCAAPKYMVDIISISDATVVK